MSDFALPLAVQFEGTSVSPEDSRRASQPQLIRVAVMAAHDLKAGATAS